MSAEGTQGLPMETHWEATRKRAREEADRLVGKGDSPRNVPFLKPEAFGVCDQEHMPTELPYPNPVCKAMDAVGRSPTTIEVTWTVPLLYDDVRMQTAYTTAVSFPIINQIFERFESWSGSCKPLGGWLDRYGD